MAVIDATVRERARLAVRVASKRARVVAAYLFGSQVDGVTDEWSDIDVALFIEGAQQWNLNRRAALSGEIQDEVGFDVEPHYYPAESLQSPEPASFAAYILRHGVPIPVDRDPPLTP